MKNINDFINNLNEGWSGREGNEAYDKILQVWETMSQEDILNMIWNYFSDKQLKDLYKWMEQDDYFNNED